MPTPRNGLLKVLAVASVAPAVGSAAAYVLSVFFEGLAHHEGSPTDEAILYSFLYSTVIGAVVIAFLPRARIGLPPIKDSAIVFFKSLPLTGGVWLVVAFLGSKLMDTLVRGTHEEEWFQISLVLLSTAATFIIWDRRFAAIGS